MIATRNGGNWQVILRPDRGLSQQGLSVVLALIVAVNVTVSSLFWLAGAWPVGIFAGLDVLAVWLAFMLNAERGRRLERVLITTHEVIIQKMTSRRSVQTHRLVRNWVKVTLEQDIRRQLTGKLYLKSKDVEVLVGAFLPPSERNRLAKILSVALVRTAS